MTLTAQELEKLMPDASQLLSDEPEMESSLHYMQLLLLVTCLEWLWRDKTDFFIGANLTIYFSRQQLKNRDFRGPDFFLVKQTEKRPRNAWVVWEEDGKYPNLIIELLSNSTAAVDRNLKKVLYQDRFRTPEYFWFSPETFEFAGFRLNGHEYQAIAPNQQGWRWSKELGLFLGVEAERLRYFTSTGDKVPTPEEAAAQATVQFDQTSAQLEQTSTQLEQTSAQLEEASAQLEQERQQREAAQRHAAILRERLRSLGIDPNQP